MTLTLLGQARLAQGVTVGWMVVEAAIAIAAGIAGRSVALTAFGVDSGVMLFSSLADLSLSLQRSKSEERVSPPSVEPQVSLLVGFALYGLIAYIVLSAAVSLVLR